MDPDSIDCVLRKHAVFLLRNTIMDFIGVKGQACFQCGLRIVAPLLLRTILRTVTSRKRTEGRPGRQVMFCLQQVYTRFHGLFGRHAALASAPLGIRLRETPDAS
jgi:hypothetical protein